MNNVAKHDQATEVQVTLEFARDRVTLTVRDNGVGFNVKHLVAANGRGWYVRDEEDMPGSHIGLFDICERARILGGKVDLASRAGDGTSLTVVIPLDNNEGDTQNE